MKTPSLVVRYIAHRAVPFIQLYALYVLGHGEDGPGGGFQGGVIFAASFVLIALAFGYERGRKEAPQSLMDILSPTGAMLYAGIGLLCVVLGGAFLGYDALVGSIEDPHTRHLAHHFGLMGIELGVMLTVTASMVTLFFEISRPDDPAQRAEDHAPELDPGGEAAAWNAPEPAAPAEGGDDV